MAESGGDVLSFRNARKNQANAAGNPSGTASIPPIARQPPPRPPPQDAVPPPAAEKKGLDKDHKKRHWSHETSEEEKAKKLKQKTLDFLTSGSLASIPAITAKGFFTKDFRSKKMISSSDVLETGKNLLNNADAASNWSTFCEFQARASTIAHHMFMNPLMEAEKLKKSLKEAQASNQQALEANIALADDNAQLKNQVKHLSADLKDMDTKVIMTEKDAKLQVDEIEHLKMLLAQAEKERDLERAAKEQIMASAHDKIFAEHEAGFQHAVRQMLYYFDVPNRSVFDMDKDVYDGRILPLDDIPKDVVLKNPFQQSIPDGEAEYTHGDAEGNEDNREDNAEDVLNQEAPTS